MRPTVAPKLTEIQPECSESLISSAITDREEVLVAVTDIPRSDGCSDNAKLKSAGILGKYYSLFDGAFGDEPRRSSDDFLQELEQLLESA